MQKKKPSAEALVAAVSNGKIADADELLVAGADLNQKVDGRTALHFVVSSRRSLPGFMWLLAKGASLDELDNNDLTPLMTVCGSPGSKAARMALALIEAGCDVTVRRDGDGMSALEFAAGSADASVIRALVDKGAALDGQKGQDLFPALLAARGGNLANLKTLVELGCDLARKTQLHWAKGMTCLGIARLERRAAIVKYLEGIGAP